MRCLICGIVVDDIEKAIEEGWIPCFYNGEQQHDPACPGCSETILEAGEDEELQVKSEYRGKVKFLDDLPESSPQGDLIMGVMISTGNSGTKH
jgi:predicted  nucleic acid-binding Zn-ribbon protein